MTVEKLQLQLIQYILKINNLGILKTFIKIAKSFSGKENLPEEEDDYIHPKGIPFEVWNKQFGDEEKLDIFDEENGMTLRAFRKMIWDAEQSEELPIEQLYKHLNKRIDDLQSKNPIQV